MHSLHYENLPLTLRDYCQQPEHRYSTRYRTLNNYVLPCPATNRSQRSIKFAGPKAWVEVPKQLKEIAFRKPFSKKLKEHILSSTFVEMPPKRTNIQRNNETDFFDLNTLFDTDDEHSEFFGFYIAPENNEVPSVELSQIFSNSYNDEPFLGFTSNTPRSPGLNSVFDESTESDFFGF